MIFQLLRQHAHRGEGGGLVCLFGAVFNSRAKFQLCQDFFTYMLFYV